MARRGNGNDGDNNAKIKIVYFEAENVSSDLTGMIHAFATAVRTAPVHVMPNAPRQIESQRTGSISGNGHSESPLNEDEDDVAEVAIASSPKRTARPRKPFKGEILTDIPWDGGGTSLDDYVKLKNPGDVTTKRYLVIAAWFSRFGGRPAVTANLIYNAYRMMSWGALGDWGHTLQEGMRTKHGYYTGDGKGNYTITPVGLQIVDKMGTEKPGSDE